MNDLISRQAAIDAFGLSEKSRKYGGDHSGYDTRMLYEIQNVLEDLPPVDAVPVVRCKNCDAYIDSYCYRNEIATQKNDFCSMGRRRKDSDE